MANKTIQITEPGLIGGTTTGLTLELYAEGGSSIVNGSGDSLTYVAAGKFTATVTEALSGIYQCQIMDGTEVVNDRTARSALVWIPGDVAGTYTAGSESELARYAFNNQVYPPVIRSVDDTNAIRFLFPTANATFSTKTVSIDFGSAVNAQGAISYIGALGTSYEYQLAYDADDRPTAEGTARYTFSDGTNTRYVTLNVTARGSTVVVQPISGTVSDDIGATTLNYRLNETKAYAVTCYDADGTAVTLTGMTLTITFERLGSVTDKAVVNSGDITISGSTFTFTNPAAVTNEVGQLKWDLWNGTTWLMGGIATVDSAAKKDA